jgi:CTD small phosphatase-like protein 2
MRPSSKRIAAKAASSSPPPEPETEEQYLEDEFDPFLFIKNLPPLTAEMKNRISALPVKRKGLPLISLALDLDETLVHCSVEPLENAELTFTVTFNGVDYEVYVRKRPGLEEFLKQVSEWFEVIVFTASQQVYADKLLDILDPEKKYISHRVFRDSCVCVDGNYLKDLHILGRDLKHTAIVDNSVQAFGFQLNNGIPIESWFDDPDDTELDKLLGFLKQLKNTESDVRPLIKQTFRLEDFVNSL